MKEDSEPESSYREVNVVDDLMVRNRPGLKSFTITAFDSITDLGKRFNIYLRAFTRE